MARKFHARKMLEHAPIADGMGSAVAGCVCELLKLLKALERTCTTVILATEEGEPQLPFNRTRKPKRRDDRIESFEPLFVSLDEPILYP
jgi:hypothetical protein